MAAPQQNEFHVGDYRTDKLFTSSVTGSISYKYIGYLDAGSSTGSMMVKRITYDASGNATAIGFSYAIDWANVFTATYTR